jgi:hypothetical protein
LRHSLIHSDSAHLCCWALLLVAFPACFLPWAPLAGLAAFFVVVVLPGVAVARWVVGLNPDADLAEILGLSIAGAAISIWTLWMGAVALGVSRPMFGLLPGVIACSLVTFQSIARTGSTTASGINSGTSAAPAESGTGPTSRAPRRTLALLLLVSLVFTALSAFAFTPYGLERGDGVHHMGMTDWHKHLVVATALSATETMPPRNPFLYSVASGPYYYGFHLLGAAVHRAAGGSVDVFVALLLLTLLVAAALPFVLFVLARGLTGSNKVALVAAIGGTLLGGFDMAVMAIHAMGDIIGAWPLPGGLAGFRAAVPSTQLDFWAHHNERCFNPPYVATIWAPQHMLAVLISLLVIHTLRGRDDRPDRPAYGYLLPALLLAALPAISSYVALALAAGACVLLLVDSWREHRMPWRVDSFARWGYAGLLAAALATPVLYSFARVGSSGRLTLHVSSAAGWQNGAFFSALFGDFQWSRLLDTPAFYVMELGIVGLAGGAGVWLLWRRRTGNRALVEASVFIVTILVLVTLVRPPVDGPNNLFARSMLIVWALLAVFAADVWVRYCEKRRLCWVLVVVCAIAVPYAAIGVTLEGTLFWPTPSDFLSAARSINTETPTVSVVAIHPDDETPAFGYWLRRRQVATYERVALLFGATSDDFQAAQRALREAYGSTDSQTAEGRFADLEADIIIVDRARSAATPVWARRPCFELQHEGERFDVYRRIAGCAAAGRE